MGARATALPEVLRGTLDLLILKALSWGPAHGYAVARWIQQATGDALAIGEGTLYPALHRLEERGWIAASWGASENNRQAKFYALTRAAAPSCASKPLTGSAMPPPYSPPSTRRR